MPINDFKPFAAGPGANVTSQADWENLPALLSGFMSGKASSAQINKAFRQVSFIAAALAQFVSEKTDQDVLDDGDLPGFVEKLTAGFAAQYLSRSNPFGDIASDGPAAIATALSNLGIVSASLTTQGLVRLTSSRVSGAEDIAATANAVAQNYTDIKALQGKTNDATPTNKGIIRVSDSRTSTESGVAASSLAVSQNYQDIKTTFGQAGEKGRIIGVTYTNTQAMTLYVHVSGVASEGSVFLSANVNGVNMNGSQCANIVGQRVCISFMVPAGATYQVGISAGSLSSQSWVETDKK
ncbi:phage tail protein [Citrobacter freundii]|nr:phage tail protein [Citrobacter freundii]